MGDTGATHVYAGNAKEAGASNVKQKDAKQTPDGFDKEEYNLRKRLPRRLPKRKNDVYISRKTDFYQQFARCQKLFDSGWNEIFIHGLGAAINRAINLALQLKSKGMGSIEVSVHTSTVELTDDLEPEQDNQASGTQTRNNSAVHIKLFRPKEFTLDQGTNDQQPSPRTDHG